MTVCPLRLTVMRDCAVDVDVRSKAPAIAIVVSSFLNMLTPICDPLSKKNAH